MCRELLYRTGGELPFTEVYQHLLSRPRLAQDFGLHLMGGGGELLRYFPWGQEFFGVGRGRLANVERSLDYRFLDVAPPPLLFSRNFLPALRSPLGAHAGAICRDQPGARTTQQLDGCAPAERGGREGGGFDAVDDAPYEPSPTPDDLRDVAARRRGCDDVWRTGRTHIPQEPAFKSLADRKERNASPQRAGSRSAQGRVHQASVSEEGRVGRSETALEAPRRKTFSQLRRCSAPTPTPPRVRTRC